MLGVDPTQSYWKNTKKNIIQEFHRFRYKNLLEFIILNNFL